MNKAELTGASGQYEFQYLSNNNHVFLRKDVDYRYGTGYYDHKFVKYCLSYRDGDWRLRRNDSNKSDWSNAEIVIRRKIFGLYLCVLIYDGIEINMI